VPFRDNVKKQGRGRQATDDNIIRLTRNACWIIKATITPSEYVVLIAFPLQQYLHERRLDVTLYVHCLPCYDLSKSYSTDNGN